MAQFVPNVWAIVRKENAPILVICLIFLLKLQYVEYLHHS